MDGKKPARLFGSLLIFPVGMNAPSPAPGCVCIASLALLPLGLSHLLLTRSLLPPDCQTGVFIAFSPPQPVMGSSPKPVLGLEHPALKAKLPSKLGVSQVSKALVRTPAPTVLPCSVTDASQHLHLFQRHLRSFSLPSTH